MNSVSNWSKSAVSNPRFRWKPETVDQLAGVVAQAAAAGQTVRVIGAGHSFTNVAMTDDHLVSLDRLSGVVSVDPETKRVRVRAGTRLRDLPGLLRPLGLAVPNQGDVDPQSVAGALSTSTHGTGLGYTGFAGITTGLTLLTAEGEILELSRAKDPEVFDLARVSLGVLGIVLEVELACVDAFDLIAQESGAGFEELTEDFIEISRRTDHAEFFWFPHTDAAVLKTNTRVPSGAPAPAGLEHVGTRSALNRFVNEELLDNAGLRAITEIGRLAPRAIPALNKVAGVGASDRAYRAPAHEVFVSPRRVRFNEMEYSLPLEEGPQALREIRDLIESKGLKISFPVEVRTTAGDDAALSTATGRDSFYIAVHRFAKEDYVEFFAPVEEILYGHGGRPHWGKIHTLRHPELRTLYPRFDEFCALREQLDPRGTFMNRHTERLFLAD